MRAGASGTPLEGNSVLIVSTQNLFSFYFICAINVSLAYDHEDTIPTHVMVMQVDWLSSFVFVIENI